MVFYRRLFFAAGVLGFLFLRVPSVFADGVYTGTWCDADGNCYDSEPSSGSSGGSSSSGSSYSGPSWAEIRRQQRQQKAVGINEEGNVYFNNGDYKTAVEYYEKASKINPDDGVIWDNLRRAKGSLLNQQGLALAEQGKYREALKKYKEAYALKPESDGIRKNLEYAQKVVDDWAAQKERRVQNTRTAQNLAQQLSGLADNLTPARSTATLGEHNRPSDGLQLMDLSADLSAPPKPAGGSNTSAGAQAKSILRHSQQALEAGTDEAMKAESAMGFDTAGIYQGDADVVDLRGVPEYEQDPGIPEEYQSSPDIVEFVRERTEIREERKDLEKKLETLEKDPSTNTAVLAEVKMEISKIQNKEIFLNFSIKERLKKAPQLKQDIKSVETPPKNNGGLQPMPLKGQF